MQKNNISFLAHIRLYCLLSGQLNASTQISKYAIKSSQPPKAQYVSFPLLLPIRIHCYFLLYQSKQSSIHKLHKQKRFRPHSKSSQVSKSLLRWNKSIKRRKGKPFPHTNHKNKIKPSTRLLRMYALTLSISDISFVLFAGAFFFLPPFFALPLACTYTVP